MIASPQGAHADLWRSFQVAAQGRRVSIRWVPSYRSKEAVRRWELSADDRMGNAGAGKEGDGGP